MISVVAIVLGLAVGVYRPSEEVVSARQESKFFLRHAQLSLRSLNEWAVVSWHFTDFDELMKGNREEGKLYGKLYGKVTVTLRHNVTGSLATVIILHGEFEGFEGNIPLTHTTRKCFTPWYMGSQFKPVGQVVELNKPTSSPSLLTPSRELVVRKSSSSFGLLRSQWLLNGEVSDATKELSMLTELYDADQSSNTTVGFFRTDVQLECPANMVYERVDQVAQLQTAIGNELLWRYGNGTSEADDGIQRVGRSDAK
ncbi:hypothetical protein NG895_16305 [Aeoliella sp. ICT_H6.2]|uniref:Uncharacterized protein n=1 Tax=Aeoliella straminimaris TaxID=2954799 RepID=A0A9X2FBH0_9BACT|nr:hypothetical protein [Aeoliella straminimaris]MCO6045474.1 hypothetical protein [Aeoliella straminimaris]